MLSASERDAGALWAAALDALAGRASPRTRAALAAATSPLELLPGSLRVAARASELRAWIASGALSLLRAAVERLTDGAQALALVPVPTGADPARDPRLDFSSFIASPANAAARERIRRLATQTEPGAGVLVHGAPGSGKTHLLRCAAAALRARFGAGTNALGADALVLQLVEALWNDGLEAFRERLDGSSCLIIDGLETLEGRDATQEELARALGEAEKRGAPVLLASARPGPQLRQIVPALAERLASHETFELTAPGWETRVAIVLDRVRAWDARAAHDVAAQLATALRSDLDRLDAVLTRLMAESGAATGLDDPALVQQILDGGTAHRPPPPEQVIELVTRHFGVRLRELRSTSRAARTSTPRQIAIYLLRRHCGLSYPEVGRHFRRHHTTALHSDRLVQRQLHTDAGLRATVILLEKELRSGAERGR